MELKVLSLYFERLEDNIIVLEKIISEKGENLIKKVRSFNKNYQVIIEKIYTTVLYKKLY
jgi:hypothetical protein